MMTPIPRPALAGATLAASLALALPSAAQEMGHDHMAMPPASAPAQPARPDMPMGHDMSAEVPMDHDMGDMPAMSHEAMPGMSHGGMTSALGAFPMTRDGSGTSWQPDASPHEGVHAMVGGWMTMNHALLNLVYDDQGGPRGGDKAFLAGMLMTMAQRPLGGGTVGLKAMLSPDPLMGKSGYPLLLATGETADGKTPLVDRQHPHDLFMELSASYSHPLGRDTTGFLYAGLPGEPAFGPPAFMHRASILASPEAPITHHWLDSTHITFGVVTAGLVHKDWKIEASAFRGREPDEKRYDIETGALDSQAVRVSWNPTANWALQTSWAWIKSPEGLEPDHDEQRWSASAIHTVRLANGGLWASTLAVGRKDRTPGDALWAGLAETAYMPNDRWTLFARAERVEQDELGAGHHGPTVTVGRLSVGAIRDWKVSDHVKIGLGGLVSRYDIPNPLSASYGDPTSGMAFLRLKIG